MKKNFLGSVIKDSVKDVTTEIVKASFKQAIETAVSCMASEKKLIGYQNMESAEKHLNLENAFYTYLLASLSSALVYRFGLSESFIKELSEMVTEARRESTYECDE